MCNNKLNIYQAVNQYLSEWNPIGVPNEIADVEYTSYVPAIVNALSDKKVLSSCLMAFLQDLGTNINDEVEIEKDVDKLMSLKGTCNSHEVFIKVVNSKKLQPQMYSRLMEIFSDFFATFYKSCKDTENLYNDAFIWYIDYDDENKRVCREVGIAKSGRVIARYSNEDNRGCGIFPNSTIDERLKHYSVSFICNEEFEQVWNAFSEDNTTNSKKHKKKR